MRIRPLTNDSKGTARYLDREAEGMDPMQLYREFVQNGAEAAADRITIDGWRDPDTGRLLARITDNGTGMTADELALRLSTIHAGGKGADNYGIGARIASLPFNPAGVTFASRTETDEGMVRLVRSNDEYGVKVWATEDGHDDYVVAPDEDMLEHIGATGTAVVLHGDGTGDTWGPSASNQVRTFLSGRYLDLPGTEVYVDQPGQSTRRIQTFGDSLQRYAEGSGEMQFSDIAGLSGSIYWYILPDEQARHEHRAAKFQWGGVGLAVDDELFAYSRDYMGDFGLIYRSIKHRVALVIHVDGARMDTKRASVTLPNGGRPTPWKQLGAWFADRHPAEIRELVQRLRPESHGIDASIANLLDKEWMDKLQPIRTVAAAKEGPKSTGDDEGKDSLDEGKDVSSGGDGEVKPERPRKAARRARGGEDRAGVDRLQSVLPDVQFPDDPDDVEYPGIKWEPVANTVLVSTELPPFVREVERCTEATGHPRQMAEEAVRKAYIVELQAHVVDANGQPDPTLRDDLLTPGALYAKLLGMQSLTERVRSLVQGVAKAA